LRTQKLKRRKKSFSSMREIEATEAAKVKESGA
jgi:hypothetical protein